MQPLLHEFKKPGFPTIRSVRDINSGQDKNAEQKVCIIIINTSL